MENPVVDVTEYLESLLVEAEKRANLFLRLDSHVAVLRLSPECRDGGEIISAVERTLTSSFP